MAGAVTRIAVSASPGELRVAALAGERLVDYALSRPGEAAYAVGDLVRARVTARMAALAGAFVTLGGGVDAFWPDSAGAASASEGAVVLARVVRAAQGGKGPRIAAADAPPCSGPTREGTAGDGPLGRVTAGPDAVERLTARYPGAAVVVDDHQLLARLRPDLAERVTWIATAFDDTIEAQVDALAEAEVPLAEGGRVSIHPTPGVVVIDVDLGGAAAARDSKTRQHQAFNQTAIAEIARQIRLRELGGGIVVDLAGLSLRRRAALGPALTGALAEDPGEPRFLGFSGLGLAEILRPRVQAPLHERLSTPHAAGLAALRALVLACAAAPSRAPALTASPDVAAALTHDAAALADLARRTGRHLILEIDRTLPPLAWRLKEA